MFLCFFFGCFLGAGPKSCGRPEQPANGTLVTESFNVGNRIEYRCDPGHMAVGPTVRTCLPSGFYSEYPPICKRNQPPVDSRSFIHSFVWW